MHRKQHKLPMATILIKEQTLNELSDVLEEIVMGPGSYREKVDDITENLGPDGMSNLREFVSWFPDEE